MNSASGNLKFEGSNIMIMESVNPNYPFKDTYKSESAKPSFDFSYTRSLEDKSVSVLSEQANALLKDLIAFKGKFRANTIKEESSLDGKGNEFNKAKENEEDFISEDIRKLLELIKTEQINPINTQFDRSKEDNDEKEFNGIIQEHSKFFDDSDLHHDKSLTSVYSQFNKSIEEDIHLKSYYSNKNTEKMTSPREKVNKKPSIIEFNPRNNSQKGKKLENKENKSRNFSKQRDSSLSKDPSKNKLKLKISPPRSVVGQDKLSKENMKSPETQKKRMLSPQADKSKNLFNNFATPKVNLINKKINQLVSIANELQTMLK